MPFNSAPPDTLRDYLREIGKIPLLTTEQEREFGRHVLKRQEIKTIAEQLTEELGRSPTSTEIGDKLGMSGLDVDVAIRRGDRALRRIVQSNLRLVVSVAKRYTNRGIPMQDLIQEGSMGLMRAAEKFDATKGWKFSTYAYWWIRQGITRAIAGNARIVRLPIHITEKLNKIKKARREFVQQYARMPTIEELSEILDLKIEDLRQLRQMESPTLSLDMRIGNDEDTALMEMLSAEDSLEEDMHTDFMRSKLVDLLYCLTDNERLVVRMKFGLDGMGDRTLSTIGLHMNVSRERVRQILQKAMLKLRHKAMRETRARGDEGWFG